MTELESLTPFVGEPLALDLVNTRPRVGGRTVDLLATPDALRAWLAAEGDRLGTVDPDARLGSAEVAAVQGIREHADTAIGHLRRGEQPPARTLRALTDAERAAPPYRRLAWDGGGVIAVEERDGSPAERLAAELAAATRELLTDRSAMGAVRECAAEDCVMLFLARHPRRRWCVGTRCGNRVRVARYQQRHKSDQARGRGRPDA